MAFTGYIPPKEHSDRKNRQAFGQMKARKKLYLYKYGEQFGKEEILLDQNRMRQAEKEKNRRSTLLNGGLILALFCCSIVIAMLLMALLLDHSPPYTIDANAANAHAAYRSSMVSHNLRKDMDNIDILKSGYIAWSQKDYETAILWFQQADDASGGWCRKEYALLGLYHQRCSLEKTSCGQLEDYKNEVSATGEQEMINVQSQAFIEKVENYNRKMFAYYKIDLAE